MATKQELEARVAELEKENEALKAGAHPLPTEVLESGTASHLEEIVKSQTEDILRLESDVKTLSDELKSCREDLTNALLEKDLLADKLSNNEPDLPVTGNSIVLDGVAHVLLRKDRLADVITAHRVRYLNDDDLTLIVRKA